MKRLQWKRNRGIQQSHSATLLFLWVIGFSFLTSCGRTVVLDDDQDCGQGYFAGEGNQCLSWTPGTTIQYSFDSATAPNVSSTILSEFHSAFQAWDQKAGDITFSHVGNVAGFREDGDGKNTVYFIQSGWDRAANSQAYTRVLASGSRILEADIFVNLEDFELSVNPEAWKVHARSLFIHEIGHVLGLTHNEENFSSVMYPSLSFGLLRIQFTDDDLSVLDYAYQLIQ